MQQKAFIKQLENLNEYWPTANYEIVLYNQGLELVMKNNTTYLERLISLKNKGMRFLVCENTLKNRKISKDVFVTELVEYIPAGIAEIVEKQEQGWSYIKGGF
jgi:intracellular sulfur oxidation DsrE/DsrF family protein